MDYRIYKLNAAGRIVSGDWVTAPDEDEAMRLAQAMCDHATPTVEVWLGAQRLASLPCHQDETA